MDLQSTHHRSDKTSVLQLPAGDVHHWTAKDDGLELRNCGYAILLVASYAMLALLIGSAMSR